MTNSWEKNEALSKDELIKNLKHNAGIENPMGNKKKLDNCAIEITYQFLVKLMIFWRVGLVRQREPYKYCMNKVGLIQVILTNTP